jgi:hypothetical protein
LFDQVLDHNHFLSILTTLKPKMIILDGGFNRSFQYLNLVHRVNQRNIDINDPSRRLTKIDLVSSISLGLLEQLAYNNGYVCWPIIWKESEVTFKESVLDYLRGERFTIRMVPATGDEDYYCIA